MEAIIERVYLEYETLGSWYVNGVVEAKTMELPWKDNAHNVSCIPEGVYSVIKEKWTQSHPYPHFRILDVRSRDGILVHKITKVKDLRGCVGVGSKFQDLDGDGILDMVESTKALDHLYNIMPDNFRLTIKKK